MVSLYDDDNNNRWSLKEEMKKVFKTALELSFPDEDYPCLVTTKNKKFGDYECINVLNVSYEKKDMLLKDIAEAIKNNLPKSASEMMEDCSIHGIGFLTFKLSRIWIAKMIHKMLNDGIQTWAPNLFMKSVIVDFSSRNICEELDVGHLRPSIIVDTLDRMLHFSNVQVAHINHFGDRMQSEMLTDFLLECFLKHQPIGGFEVYKELTKRFDEDAEFRERAHRVQLGFQGYNNIYPHNQETLNLLSREESLIEESEGEKVIFVEEKKMMRHHICERKKKPLTVVKKNGVYDDALSDLTVLRQTLIDLTPDWIVYVADVGKKEYIEMCFSAARRAGWLTTDEDEFPTEKFVGCGLVQGDDLNRSGKLVDLIDDAKTRCKAALLERGKADELTAEDLENNAKTLAYGALKYALLKNFRVFNDTLNFDEMLNDKGNTGVYLLYTHAQICSMINESGKDIEELKKTRELKLEKDEERELGLYLLQFTEVLFDACTTVFPDILCAYLYGLSKKFTSFHSVTCQAVGDADEEANRLLVCEATRVVMTKCFYLLGITPLDKISMTIPPPVDRDDNGIVMELFSSDEDKEEMVSSSSGGEDKEDIISSSSSEEDKEEMVEEEEKALNPRFQLFSVHVRVDEYETDCKPCSLFGSITVSDMFVSSEADGWVPLDDPDYGNTDLFNRDWCEPVPIVNNDYIETLIHPRTHRSIPFIDFLDIHTDLSVIGKDDNKIFQVSSAYRCLSLSKTTYDRFNSKIMRGPDGLVELYYIVLSDPVDAALEMMFIPHPPANDDVFKQPLSVKIFAYYAGAGYDYGSICLRKNSYYLTLLEDASVTMFDKTKLPLNTSVLAVPANGTLVIDVLIKDSNKFEIVKKIFKFPAKRKGSSKDQFDGAGCSIELKVNWKCVAAT